jgi:nucleoside-diphosphate-sugar epimerase
MNAWLPAVAARRYKDANIVVYSSGNIYPFRHPREGGADESTPVNPVGEYAMSCLARERVFEYFAHANGTKMCLFRLNYAVDLRYGVLFDIAQQILDGTPITLNVPAFNCIWQGTANEMALRCLLHCTHPVNIMNVAGPETYTVRHAAERLGALLGKTPIYADDEGEMCLLSNAGKAFALFGYPAVPMETLIQWQAEWILNGGRSLGKPTHFEQSKGRY